MGAILTAATERIVIPRCIGCGAMHEFERCEHGCHEQHLELIAAGELDALEAAWQAATVAIEAALPVLGELAERRPADGEHRQLYESLAVAARRALRETPPVPWPRESEDAGGAPVIGVWRCPDCGAVDAPQECLGICIWRRFEWVRIEDYSARLEQVQPKLALAHRTLGLLRRLAFATPRAGAWERSWQALSRESEELLASARHVREGHRAGEGEGTDV